MLTLNSEAIAMVTKEQLLSVIEAQADIIIRGLSLQQVMEKMATLAEELTFASGAVVEMVEGDEMVYQAATGKAREQLGLRLKRNNSLSGLCIREGKVLNCHDAATDPRVDFAACQAVGLTSMLVVPLRFQDELVGVLKVFSPKQNAFDDVDAQILDLAAKVISASIVASQRDKQAG
ncbi:GAF domain-containing protein [Bowmanella dokdonensis]|uniref:GAF domain-containing protein n=1 Tax=Bowmanella dokdonensis TaxID=751969 RepID=A0A939DNF2_9ALTE|nr:GAF domain-containing protein [Bowmanella dokdonensis]MBN7825728.1 GAF domain-containing protein [Bowmanella dokdonensis]